ncbi:flagellar biosynthesis anti-sigma factor FlgM [candidate division KSB1 bacterium]
MNISEISPISNSQPVKKTVPKKKTSSEGTTVADQVQISPKARSLQSSQAVRKAALSALKTTPDVRDDKLKEVRQKIESGFYNQPQVMNDVANRIIDNIG